MAEPVILTWNTTNWATVTLMALASFFVAGLVMKFIASRQGDES